MLRISYAILTHNEGSCIKDLFEILLKYKDPEDEIIVVDDYSNDRATVEILLEYSHKNLINLYFRNLDKDFASQKNYLMSKCSGEFILNVDADEIVKPELILNIKEILELNPEIDLYAVPRENVVIGITDEHIKRWKWNVNKNGFINYPDLQFRIIRNVSYISWKGKVHERPEGAKTISTLPDELALIHKKDISKQEKQNNFYDTV
jgi:glycosyltransferase involved in cell wall biosynthesis